MFRLLPGEFNVSVNPPTDRETLYEEVWAEPITVVAKRYGMSDVDLIKKCGRMKIPVPRRVIGRKSTPDRSHEKRNCLS